MRYSRSCQSRNKLVQDREPASKHLWQWVTTVAMLDWEWSAQRKWQLLFEVPSLWPNSLSFPYARDTGETRSETHTLSPAKYVGKQASLLCLHLLFCGRWLANVAVCWFGSFLHLVVQVLWLAPSPRSCCKWQEYLIATLVLVDRRPHWGTLVSAASYTPGF